MERVRKMRVFGAFTAVMFNVEVFWVVTPCSVVVGYQHFRGPCCLKLEGEVKAGWASEMLVSYHNNEDLDLEVSEKYLYNALKFNIASNHYVSHCCR
jgi:hypothetical protein